MELTFGIRTIVSYGAVIMVAVIMGLFGYRAYEHGGTAFSTVGPARKVDTSALHRAATTLRELLENGFDLDTIGGPVSQLRIEYDAAETGLSKDAHEKCNRATAISDSLVRIVPVLASGDPDVIADEKFELEKLGVIKSQKDWEDFQYHLSYLRPGVDDTSVMTAERAQLRRNLATETFGKARRATVMAVKVCEEAI